MTEINTNGYKSEILDILFLICIIFGIFVIIAKNPIISILCLIGLFIGISGYLIILGLNFIGLSYLLVYVGAVSILFLFILMLINIRVSELITETNNSIPLAFITGTLFYYFINIILPYNFIILYTNKFNLFFRYLLYTNYEINENLDNINNITYVISNNWDNNLSENTHITSIGNIMYTNYSIWLIITSIILLLAMVGSIVITLKQRS